MIQESEEILSNWSEDVKNSDSENFCNSDKIKNISTSERYINYGFALVDGQIQCSLIPFDKDKNNLAERIPEFNEVVKNEEFRVTNFGYSSVSNEARVGVGYPHLDSDGKLIGVLFLSLRLEEINEYIGMLDLPADSEFLVTDEDGAILVAYPTDNSLLGQKKFTAVTYSLILSQKSGILDFKGDDGTNRTYVYEPFFFEDNENLTSFMIFGLPNTRNILTPLVTTPLYIVLMLATAILLKILIVFKRKDI